ncbi:glycosyl-transferase for dystroglycan-domain-containing protein [Dunaliella salina]|uniref:Glycosyl-transferase for dystroglycan-domain-containing protein n=1 Tax=Dunaliella salina TaxID=3046 RepID=A0ABQ7FUR0_DUNSA|nr:glycosyl-transferase for dystroglycan-domain-containing protein [Dunaliella salina]|eukprot:KAF5826120.1 glycosyl-transferase for dystroglycan-domain-containing protein [Dunaliella salina]
MLLSRLFFVVCQIFLLHGNRFLELESCINPKDPPRKTSWSSSLQSCSEFSCTSNVILRKTWFSSEKPRIPVTIITQLSIDRKEVLQRQCKSYMGPVVAAVYAPLIQPDWLNASNTPSEHNEQYLTQIEQQLTAIHRSVLAPGSCQLTMLLFYELFDSVSASVLYPVNALRNFARMVAQTNLIFPLDVDMLVSKSFSNLLSNHSEAQKMEKMSAKQIAFILPALEVVTGGLQVEQASCEGSKQAIVEQFNNGVLQQFKKFTYPLGHRNTDYRRWLSNEVFDADWEPGYEPYMVLHWDHLPWFHIGFKGFGLNKVSFVADVHHRNISFKVITKKLVFCPSACKRKKALQINFSKKHCTAEMIPPSMYDLLAWIPLFQS